MIRILAVSEDWAVCVKPVGPDAEQELPALLLKQLGGQFFPVHRLDRNVGGVMVYARSSPAAAELSRLIREGLFAKEYLALCHGSPPEEGRLEDLLFRDSARNKVYVVSRPRKGVKEAVLTYRVLARPQEGISLVRIRLQTGRSHQIRVQFASRGWPLVGDRRYGARDGCKAPMLYSCRISFPWKKEEMKFEDLPEWAQIADRTPGSP